MRGYREIDYTDTLLADGSAHRRFADGREEWRSRHHHVVRWRDNQGYSGTDEPLGPKIVKRTLNTGQVLYGRELGYGRTVWGNGTLTRNRTSFRGRMGALLAAVGAGALLGAVVAPPVALSLAEEEELRRQAQQAQSNSDGDDGANWGDDGSGDTDDGSDFG
jgi:hypothetical protein